MDAQNKSTVLLKVCSGSVVAMFFPLLNDRNQSAADHHGSTATGQLKRPFPFKLRTSSIGQKRPFKVGATNYRSSDVLDFVLKDKAQKLSHWTS
jgi:hypothetical protein